MSGYIGNIPVPQATQTRDDFTATASQTTFATSGYTPGYLDVYLNGVHLDSFDYTATNGSDVVLASSATAGDVVSVVAFTTFTLAEIPTGATGGGTDAVFYENDQTVTADYTITTDKNAMSAGPVTINTGVTVTVPSGSVWTIV